MKAAIYCRQSIDLAIGVADQERRGREIADERGWDLVQVFRDDDVSATHDRGDGTGWAAMMGRIRARDLDAVVITDVDRLNRSTDDALAILNAGLAWVVTLDDAMNLHTASGRKRFLAQSIDAEFETGRKKERALRGNERRAAAGTYRNGARPFGYAADHWSLHPTEAPLVQDAYARILGGGSLFSIARDWNRRGVPTHSATLQKEALERADETGASPEAVAKIRARHVADSWSTPAVKAILLRERNIGRVVLRGAVQDGVQARWEPLIDTETFEQARAILTSPARHTSRGARPRFLASGIAVCGVCGAPMRSNRSHERRTGEPFEMYRCSRVSRDPGTSDRAHPHATARITNVDPLLSTAVYDALQSAPEGGPVADGVEAARHLHEERADLVRRRQEAQVDMFEPDADKAHLRRLRAEWTSRIEAIDAELQGIADDAARASGLTVARAAGRMVAEIAAQERAPHIGEVVDMVSLRGAWENYWSALDLEQKRALIRATIRIVINPARSSARPAKWKLRPIPGKPGHVEFAVVRRARDGKPHVDIKPRVKKEN